MQSDAKNVMDYLKAPLAQIRKLCKTTLKGFEESMDYGGPCYSRNGEV